jgi:hypothetical protein
VRVVDEGYLTEQWERGRPDLVFSGEGFPQWLFAVFFASEGQMAQQLRRASRGAKRAWGDGEVSAEWGWLRLLPDPVFGLAVRPAVPLLRLGRFAAEHWREARRKPVTRDGRIAREIVDYLAVRCTVRYGPKAWRERCRKALWFCFQPLLRELYRRFAALERREEGAKPRQSGRMRELLGIPPPEQARYMEEFRFLARHYFDEALAQYDAFHGGFIDPALPLGLLSARSADGRLSWKEGGGGVPFARFLAHFVRPPILGEGDSVRAVPGWRMEEFGLQPDDREDIEEEEKEAEEEEGSAGEEERRQPLWGAPPLPRAVRIPGYVSPRMVRDHQGRRWVPIGDLAEATGLSIGVLLDEEQRGVMGSARVQSGRSVRWEGFYDLCERLRARSLLRRPGSIAEALGVPPRTFRRAVRDALQGCGGDEVEVLACIRRWARDRRSPGS